jgi:thiol-disulfide isomerase/thioredoxin
MRMLNLCVALPFLMIASLASADETLELRGTGWVNSKELSLDRLKGKVIVFFFFSEQCPTCRAEVPERNKLRKEFEGKPVVFIAVNSLNPKSVAQEYAKSTGLDWPIFVDEMGETQKQLKFRISLQNIYQWRVMDPEGKLHVAPFEQKALTEEINTRMASAKLTFDGITVPEKLKSIARDIEWGLFDPAISEIATLLAKGPKDLQESAQAMYDKLKPMAEAGLERAKSLEGEGKKYPAYTEYAKVASWFKKTDYEKTATAAMLVLKKDKEVQEELAAKQLLDQAKALLSSPKKADREGAPGILAALQKKYPNTEAAKEAANLTSK